MILICSTPEVSISSHTHVPILVDPLSFLFAAHVKGHKLGAGLRDAKDPESFAWVPTLHHHISVPGSALLRGSSPQRHVSPYKLLDILREGTHSSVFRNQARHEPTLRFATARPITKHMQMTSRSGL